MPDKADLGVGQRDLAVLQLADLIEQQQRGGVETRRRAARQIHLVGHFDAAKTGARGLQQAGPCSPAAGELPPQRHPGDIPLGRPDERLGLGNETGLVVDQPHARHGLHRRHRAAPAVLREGLGRKGDVAAGNRDPPSCRDGILERGIERAARSASSGGVLVQAAKAQKMTNGITPGHHLLLHLKSPCIRVPAGSGNAEKTNPCGAVKPEITRRGDGAADMPANWFLQRSLARFEIGKQTGQPL